MNRPRLVIDTNVLVSAIIYKGKPREVFDLAIEDKIKPVISEPLFAELMEVLTKKFVLSEETLDLVESEIKDIFTVVHPTKTINVLDDKDDNRVLEAALEGNCDLIITGDKQMLRLGEFKGIRIITVSQFLEEYY